MGRRRASGIEAFKESGKTGRGRGFGANYQPWLKTSDVTNSNGSRSRMYSLKCGRVIHFLSHAEAQVFLALDWMTDVVEIYEQVPLDPAISMKVAEDLDVKHAGYDRKDGFVMTTDFLVRRKGDRGFWKEAIQVKSSRDDTVSKRTQEKLKIEGEYWRREGIDWRVIYASELNRTFLRNLQTLAPYRNTRYSDEELSCLMSYFLRARNAFPDAEPSQLAQAVLSLIDDNEMTAWDVVAVLAGKRLISCPIETKDLFSCALQEFRPNHVSEE